ncbi:tetraspanin-8-like [Trachinotus anak]|uniref:tetraspanin-8-like n=1 Tax=Trachinotus anak TaxID=443729 RepID=UPI0039F17604
MGKVNVCLRRSYITVASVIGVMSALLLAFTLFGHGHLHDKEEEFTQQMQAGIHATYVISIVPLLLTISGVFGTCKKKQWALILFAVGMILGSLFMFVTTVNGLVNKPKLVQQLKEPYLDMGPLNNISKSFHEYLNATQMELQCCGLDQGYMDWGYDIPESCICTEESTNPCVAAPRDSILFDHRIEGQPIMIYKEPCLPHLIKADILMINIMFGVTLGVTLLWVLSVVLSILILCQLNRKEDTPAVVYSAEAKAGNYTTLAEFT